MRIVWSIALLVLAVICRNGAARAAGDNWELEWARTVKAAEEEGEAVIYKISGDAEWHAFEKKYPKIKVKLVHGNASQVLQRIMAERRADKFLGDVARLGGGTSTTLLKGKALDPITSAFILPEVKDPSKWFEGKHHFNDSENKYTLAYAAFPLRLVGYNTKLIDPKGISSFLDFLDPKWKGKITIKDPREPGGGSPLLFLYHSPTLGPEFIKRFLTSGNLTLIRDENLQTNWLANGQYPLAITAKAEDVDVAKSQGLPVDVLDAHALRKDGVGLEAGGTMISLLNKAPHPNAAKVLINWFLSREGQLEIQKAQGAEPGRNSLREDIPKDMLPAWMHRQKGVNYVRLWGPEVWDRTPIRKLIADTVK
ncbi:MAG TPA: extracellular solute-binding protein [Candidatus Acidoferrales bacterium]|nr:extracellular solute-binding protein [Candidatus Acidoferrales bacterium]